jgi:hypothetical protein
LATVLLGRSNTSATATAAAAAAAADEQIGYCEGLLIFHRRGQERAGEGRRGEDGRTVRSAGCRALRLSPS